MNLLEAINHAAASLPPLWNIRLVVENGAGWVELVDPLGDVMETPLTETLAGDINEAVQVAISKEVP